MADRTGISWTHSTWNPIRGCSRVSEGCRHCYAERVAARFSGPGQPYEGLARRKLTIVNNEERDPGNRGEARWTGEVRLVHEHLADPLRWRRPRRIFVNSMSDLFHERLTNDQIAAVFGVMSAAPQHTFQVLTKRARRMREWFEWRASGKCTVTDPRTGQCWDRRALYCWDAALATFPTMRYSAWDSEMHERAHRITWPLPNVWLGVSTENQEAADERIPDLLATPAAVRFISAEPLLGSIDLQVTIPGLSWIITGCESGPGARPADVAWFRSLRDQCRAARVPFFLKQAAELGNRMIARTRFTDVVAAGPGSKRKPGVVIELPYLDGVQHAAFPEVAR